MIKFINLLKRISMSIVVLVCVLASSLYFNVGYTPSISAQNDEYNPKKLTVSTSFETSSTNYPASLSNWTSIGDTFDYISKGVISTNIDDYTNSDDMHESIDCTINPGTKDSTDDSDILMINSNDESVSSGYKTQKFELSRNSYYHISVDVYTVSGINAYDSDNEINSFASVRITGDRFSDNEKAYYNHIQTNNSWQTINFYISTNLFVDEEVYVELRLGNETTSSYGVVFFDNFVCEQLSNNQYKTEEISYGTNDMSKTSIITIGGTDYEVITYASFINLNNDINVISDFEDGNVWEKLNSTLAGNDATSISGVYSITSGYSKENTGVDNPTNAFMYGNTKALLINNTSENSVGYKSGEIDILRNRVYALSIDIKTGDSQQACLNLVKINNSGNSTLNFESTYDSISTSSDDNNARGGWETYTFFVQGRFDMDCKIQLEVWVGKTSAASGYAWFDNLRIQEISFEQLNAYSKSDNTKLADLSNLTGASSLIVSNGFFNSVTSSTIGGELTPNSWTLKTKTSITENVSATVVDDGAHINVLKLQNKVSTASMVVSNQFDLTLNTYYSLSFNARVAEISNNRVPYIALYLNDSIAYTLPLSKTSTAWNNYSLKFETSVFSDKMQIALCLGDMNNSGMDAKGIVYFDDIKVENIDETAYANLTTDKSFSLKQIYFGNDYDSINNTTTTNLLTSLSYNTPSTTDTVVNYGILNLTNFDKLSAYNSINTSNPNSNVGNYVYVINSLDDVYFYVSGATKTLSASSYYKFEITLKTVAYGNDPVKAFISLGDKLNAKITNIDTSDYKSNNGYVTYTLYVNAVDSVETTLMFGLGQEITSDEENTLSKGAIFIESIKISNIESEDYKTAENSNDKHSLCTKFVSEETEEDKEDDNKEETSNKSDVDFNFLLVPTLITALALIVAVVGTLIRKFSVKKSIKVKNEYDRGTTLVKEHNLREDKKNIDSEINNLEQEKSNKIKERDDIQSKISEDKNMTTEEENQLFTSLKNLETEIDLIESKIEKCEKERSNIEKKLKK